MEKTNLYWVDSEFHDKENGKIHWLNKASQLHASAGVLWTVINTNIKNNIREQLKFDKGFDLSVSCYPPYKMTLGLAFEALIKGKLIQNGKQIKHTHYLNQLCNELNIELTKTERETLKFLSHYIIWGGKYPTPKKLKDYKDYFSIIERTNSLPISDWDNTQALWSKIFNSK
jgi:hypothetical protein